LSDAEAIRIRLVEDDPTDTRLLISLLDHADVCEYRLQTVGTAADAERMLVNDQYDVVLLDLSLPDCDGLPSVQRVMAVAPATPIVVLTGRDDYDLGLRSIEAGAQDFLVKGEVKGNTILRCAQWSIARAAAGFLGPDHDPRWTAIERTRAGIAVIDRELRVVTANPSFVSWAGHPAADLARRPLTEFIEVDDIVEFVLGLRATLQGEAPTRQVDVRFVVAAGDAQQARLNFARIDPLEDEPPLLLLVVSPLDADAG
jgi:PAS domain S-box-containing protein